MEYCSHDNSTLNPGFTATYLDHFLKRLLDSCLLSSSDWEMLFSSVA